MKVYGVALLAGCFLTGKLIGNLLGVLIGINGDVCGVGLAMIFLMLWTTYMKHKRRFIQETEQGILFWTSMYIPIVVAMAATQNVKAAITGGWVAVYAGIGATLLGYILVPMISKIGNRQNPGN